jgi:hypothetical protein
MTAPQEVPELKVRERPTSTIRNVDGGPPGGVGCAARIRQLKLGYALDTYPIWIRIGYAVDTYPKSIQKKNRDNSDTRADTYQTILAHYWIRNGPLAAQLT